jgi:2,4-dienoyl-CoA reductase-like NADH-dependent reductase (Old Yellow Enzyme family)
MGKHPLYPAVYEPIQIGPVEIRNRVYMTPHGSIAVLSAPEYGLRNHVYARDPDDGSPLPHPDLFDYFEERARGGVGLIIMGHIEVQKGDSGRFHLTTETAVQAFRPLVDRVHQHGTKIFAQLHCGFGSPSGLPGAGFVQADGFPEPLTVEHIHRIVQLAGLSAKNATEAGFDGVELHAAHLHSTGMFLSGFTNRRTDDYGGSIENRMRFPVECLEAIRAGVGHSIAVGIRMTAEEHLPNGIDSEESCEIVRRFEALGLVDYFDLDIGHSQHTWHLWGPHYLPKSYQVPYIAKVRAAIHTAVVLGCPGRLRDPAEAQRIIASGAMDMVGSTRGFLADPEWVQKGLELHSDEIRPCTGLNGCLFEGQCVMNPANHLESLYGVTKVRPTAKPKRVVIVGAGPAGMEAARVSAQRGHSVVLLEREDKLGGQLNLHAKIPTREASLEAAKWWTNRLNALSVKVELGLDATPQDVIAHQPEVVVVSTGSTYDPTGVNGLTGREIPGWDRDFVYTPQTVLRAFPEVTGNVVVLDEDGTLVASDMAWMFAESGAATVHLVTRFAATAQNYVGALGNHRDLVQMRLHDHQVRSTVETFIREIGDRTVTLYDIWTDQERIIDNVEATVLCTLRHSRNQLATDLRDRVPRVDVLGDANAPGRMAKATRDGFFFGWNL